MLHLLLQIYEVVREDIVKIWVAKHLGRSMKKKTLIQRSKRYLKTLEKIIFQIPKGTSRSFTLLYESLVFEGENRTNQEMLLIILKLASKVNL